ncbi:helix-turn-helix transcriptional regulator [Cupriavidus sp. AU9028]|uniref:ArsR/SmtB family transcription factor n=1 Tax=Cupriavidus sp. AU9028 TaxID=2871157 RepID=UPI001C98CCD4|nr:helix-turn-helix domain-containing protein [Cupriavidus sp. AU9028]MBY4896158.1 helix-turn-helix domain-containing protein [Cupriavidus sp. AU9028]
MDPEQLDRVFKALADETRRRIIDRLCERSDQTLFEICAALAAEGDKALSRQAITQHLDMLEKAGLIRVSWSGRTRVHSLDLAPLRKAANVWLNPHLKGRGR